MGIWRSTYMPIPINDVHGVPGREASSVPEMVSRILFRENTCRVRT
jgi:hypothetical protein